MRITIRVKPGSARPGAGGEHDGGLVVRVNARAVDGKATEAALALVADSLGVRRGAVRLVSGASSRTKIIDIDIDDPHALEALLAAPGVLRWAGERAVCRSRTTGLNNADYLARCGGAGNVTPIAHITHITRSPPQNSQPSRQ